MASIQDCKEDIPLLVEAGLVAIKQGDEESAKKLFNAVGVLDPEGSAKKMGYGLISLHKMDIKNALSTFEELVHQDPSNYRAQAFLGFACVLTVLQDGVSNQEKVTNLKRGAQLAEEVLKKCDAPTTRQLAQSVLDWERQLQEKAEATGV